MNLNLRNWATPLTIGGFLISAVTGALLFFHVNIGLVRPAHEWLSWAMVLGVALHLSINWRGFTRYFSQKAGMSIVLIFAALTAASALPIANAPQSPTGGAMRALHASSLDTVARVAKRTPQQVAAALGAKGMQVQSPEQTIAEIARANGRNPMEVLATALDAGAP